jgi:inorganic pyrophosphatase
MNFSQLSIGKKAPEVVNAVIEIPKGSHNKYELDEETGIFALDRVLYSPVHYPLDYGFIPETHCEDGDHLDIMVIGGDPLFPGCLVKARPLGLMKMIDKGEKDYKIIAVQKDNPRFESLQDFSDLERHYGHLLKEIAHFFLVYKELEGKKVEIGGWEGKEAACAEIIESQKMFREKDK